MRRLETGISNNQSGFTLVEILIVLLIIGITISFALLAFGDFGATRRVELAAEQFANYVKLVQQHAILETGTFGILVEHKDYQAFRFDLVSGWQTLSAQSVFRLREFPSVAEVSFQTKMNSSPHTPQIIINESGDMTAFQLAFKSKGTDVAVVQGHHSGLIQIKSAVDHE